MSPISADKPMRLRRAAAQPGENSTVGLLVSVDETSMVVKSKKGFHYVVRATEVPPPQGITLDRRGAGWSCERVSSPRTRSPRYHHLATRKARNCGLF